MNVVVEPAAGIGSVREGDEDCEFGLGLRTDEIDDVLHRYTAPLRNSRPALNAVVLRDLLMLGHSLELGKGNLPRALHQAANLQLVVGKVTFLQTGVFGNI